MRIKYKVVKRKSRMSAMINGNSKYARRYLDGDSVHAHGGTVGILVFETLTAAECWAGVWNEPTYSNVAKDLIVLKVIPIGRGKRINFLAEGIDTEALDHFYHGNHSFLQSQCPERTMAYPGVHVLDPVYE